MFNMRKMMVAALMLFGAAGLVLAGPLTGVNLVKNGDFELPAIGDDQPQQWDSFATSDPAGWDGVTAYKQHGSQIPPQLAGHGQQVYGDYADQKATGSIDQVIDNVDRECPKAIWVSLWVYSFSYPPPLTAGAKIKIDQPVTGKHWESGFLTGRWTGSGFDWQQHSFLIPETEGFKCYDLILTIDLDTGNGDVPN